MSAYRLAFTPLSSTLLDLQRICSSPFTHAISSALVVTNRRVAPVASVLALMAERVLEWKGRLEAAANWVGRCVFMNRSLAI